MKELVVFCLAHMLCFSGATIILDSGPNPVNEGMNFTFSCNNTEQDGLIAYEVNGDTSGDLFDRVIANINFFVGEFVFPNVSRNDNGTLIECSGGSQSPVTVTLVVHYPGLYEQPSPDTFQQFINSQLTVNLMLQSGFPDLDFVWERNGITLDASPNISLSLTSLEISSLAEDDNGTYTVTASNSAGNTSATFYVIVYFGPILAQANGSSIFVTLNRGDSFTIDCSADRSNPSVQSYTLTINNESPTDLDIDNPVFTINNAMDSGRYRCQASSGVETSFFDYVVTVLSPSSTSAPATSAPATSTSSIAMPTNTNDPGDGGFIAVGKMELLIVCLFICLFTIIFM